MANPSLTWKYVGSAATGGTINGTLDAIYTLGLTSTNFTWNRDQPAGTTEAVYGAPTALNPLSMQYIIAGAVGANTLTVAAPDTTSSVTNTLVCGMNRGSLIYAGPAAWKLAQPFGSGFSGYWRGAQGFATLAWSKVHMWDCQEACIIQVISPTAPNPGSIIAFGALFDPLVFGYGSSCESDDRLYFMCGGGSSATYSPLGATWLNPGAAGTTLGGTVDSDGASHSGFFVPGTSTLNTCARLANFSPGTTFVNLAGDAVVYPVNVRWATGATSAATGWYAGRSRQWGIVKDVLTAQTWTAGAVTVGYTVAYSEATAGDAVALLAV